MNPVKAWREAHQLTQAAWAARLGVSRGAVARVEGGKVAQLPSGWRAGLEAMGASYWELRAGYLAWRLRLVAVRRLAP
jgi:transcriptional regulator with XRE-family HTH domain